MIVSRSSHLLKATTRLASSIKACGLQQTRSKGFWTYEGKWLYRTPKETPKWGHPEFPYLVFAELGGGFMWWWILYNCYHHYGHLIGEYPYPDTDAWTNEELGVPSTLKL